MLEAGHGCQRGVPDCGQIERVPPRALQIGQVEAGEGHEHVVELDGLQVLGVLRIAHAVRTKVECAANLRSYNVSVQPLLRFSQPVVPIL